MKRIFFPIAALALLASCSTDTKDSYQTVPFAESNLIIDTQDASQMAQVSNGKYQVKQNISKGCVDITTSDLIINNQSISFETDTMALRTQAYSYTFEGKDMTDYKLVFSKKGHVSTNGAVSDLAGSFIACYYKTGDLENPNYQVGLFQRMDLHYTYNDRYSVQTFWPTAMYKGVSVATEGSDTYTTRGSDYVSVINFEKKTASVYLYNAEFSADTEKALPKVILFDEIPVVYSHNGFSLESAAPKTKVLGKNGNKTEMIDSVGFAATDFSLFLTSSDLADAVISYKLDGKNVNFRGTSTLKTGF